MCPVTTDASLRPLHSCEMPADIGSPSCCVATNSLAVCARRRAARLSAPPRPIGDGRDRRSTPASPPSPCGPGYRQRAPAGPASNLDALPFRFDRRASPKLTSSPYLQRGAPEWAPLSLSRATHLSSIVPPAAPASLTKQSAGTCLGRTRLSKTQSATAPKAKTEEPLR